MALAEEPRTLIFTNPLTARWKACKTWSPSGARSAMWCWRELTKTWESIHGAPVGELLAWVQEDEVRRRGEMVLIVKDHKAQEDALPLEAAHAGAAAKRAAEKKAAALAAEPRREENALYKHALSNNSRKAVDLPLPRRYYPRRS